MSENKIFSLKYPTSFRIITVCFFSILSIFCGLIIYVVLCSSRFENEILILPITAIIFNFSLIAWVFTKKIDLYKEKITFRGLFKTQEFFLTDLLTYWSAKSGSYTTLQFAKEGKRHRLKIDKYIDPEEKILNFIKSNDFNFDQEIEKNINRRIVVVTAVLGIIVLYEIYRLLFKSDIQKPYLILVHFGIFSQCLFYALKKREK